MKSNQRKDYISDGLIKVRDKITPLSPEPDNRPTVANATRNHGGNKKMFKTLKTRHAEFMRQRRDLTARYSEAIVNFEEDAKRFKFYTTEIEKLQELLKKNLRELEGFGECEAALLENSLELGNASRTAENYRLELIRQNARMAKLIGAENGAGNNANMNSVIYEIASLSFSQLFKMGTGFFMPVCIAIIIGTLLVALAIIFSMGIW